MAFTSLLLDNLLKSSQGSISANDLEIIKRIAQTENLSQQEIADQIVKFQESNKTSYIIDNEYLIDSKCPKCGCNVPVVSKICDYCGYTYPDVDNSMTEVELIEKIQENLDKIQNTPQPSFLRNIFSHYYILFPLITIFLMYILFTVKNAGNNDTLANGFFLSIAVSILAVLIKVFLVFTKKQKSGFDVYMADYEKYSNIARIYYGENPQINSLLNKFYQSVQIVKTIVEKGRKSVTISYAVFSFIIIAVAIFLHLKFKKIQNERDILFSKQYGHFYENDLVLKISSWQGEFSKFANLNQSTVTGIFHINFANNAYYSSADNYVSLIIPKVQFNITAHTEFFDSAQFTPLLSLKAVISDKNHKPLMDTIEMRFLKNDLRGKIVTSEVLFVNFEMKKDSVFFNRKFVKELKENAHNIDFYSELQIYDGPIRRR